jgi:hypothetical protein
MINWTDEAMRAEADYRRQSLHRMVAQRRSTDSRRSGAWHRWMPRGRRH